MDVVIATSRPIAKFHPDIWGDRFVLKNSEYKEMATKEARESKVIEELTQEVRRELKETSGDYMRQLKMVDAIQRLGMPYLFEDEIDDALKNLLEKFDDYCKDSHDMYATALSFRLLRTHGYRVSCDIFDKFKDKEDGFIKALKKADAMAVLEFFEATHLRVHGEEVLDHAFIFTRKHLESIYPSLSNPIAEQVHNALYGYSFHRGAPRVEARKYIPIYEQYPSHHQRLLKLAKLEFNLVQNLHKRELNEISRWWKSLEVPTKIPYARDRIVETYFWASGVYFEPKYSPARMILVKLQNLVSVIDDTFDAYGTFEELQIFVDAFERWSISCLDKLPDESMKILYKAIMEVYDDIEKQMMKQGTAYRLHYVKEAFKILIEAYFDELKWREEKYNPKTQEYLNVAVKSAGYLTLVLLSFVGMEESAKFVTREAFEWVLSRPKILDAALTISRLSNDIVGYEFEQERKHIPSAIQCYVREYNVSKEEAMSAFNNVIESGWKDMNEAFLRPTEFPTSILYRILNYVRIIEIIYNKADRYTHVGTELKTCIKHLYMDPIP